MTGAQMAMVATVMGVVGTLVAGIGSLLMDGYTVGAGGVLVLYALVLAVLSLRDR